MLRLFLVVDARRRGDADAGVCAVDAARRIVGARSETWRREVPTIRRSDRADAPCSHMFVLRLAIIWFFSVC